jgi:hypothetical protein
MFDSLSLFAAACKVKTIVFIPTWYKYLDHETVGGRCTPKFTFPDDISKILLAGFEIVLFIGGLVAVAFVIYGGIQYILSQGEPERAKNARTTIINAIVGLIITMLATAITNFIGRNIA